MAQTQLIKRRIRSVSNTRQITKAMELVAASKMRRAQEATTRSRDYTTNARDILGKLSQLTDAKKQPLFKKRPIKNQLLVVITSDRGLAGAYNSNVLRMLTSTLSQAENVGTKATVIGSKGSRFVSRLENIELVGAYTDWPTEPTSGDVRPISETAIKSFLDGSVDSVQFIYTKFFSTIRQEVTVEQLLPVLPVKVEENADSKILEDAIFEPSPQAVLDAIVPRLLEAQALQVVLEAAASEQSMRMMAMKNATDNANELIDDLTLEYNSARQAGITQELAEISAGAEAIQ